MSRGGRVAGGAFPGLLTTLAGSLVPFVGVALIVAAARGGTPHTVRQAPLVHIGPQIDNLQIYVAPGTPQAVIDHEIADLGRPAAEFRRGSGTILEVPGMEIFASDCEDDPRLEVTILD